MPQLLADGVLLMDGCDDNLLFKPPLCANGSINWDDDDCKCEDSDYEGVRQDFNGLLRATSVHEQLVNSGGSPSFPQCQGEVRWKNSHFVGLEDLSTRPADVWKPSRSIAP